MTRTRTAARATLRALAMANETPRNKYGAKRIRIDGYWFDSLAEGTRYQDLKLLLTNGEITHLTIHPRFPIELNGVRVCTYVADFKYVENGALVIEDCKGFKTPIYRLKKKLVNAFYGFDIRETR